MKIKVSAGFSGKIPTGSYQNSAPSFFAEKEYEVNDPVGADGEEALRKLIDLEQKHLHDIAYQNFKIVAEAAKIEKIKNDFKGFRFYKTPQGELPSVTSILSPDFKAWVGDDELRIAVAEGNILHARVAHFIETGQWVDIKELPGVGADLLICRGRDLDYFNFPAFLEKYPITEMKNCGPVYNYKDRYAGTPDFTGLFPLNGNPKEKLVKSVVDLKRTPDKVKNFSQMSAYAKAEGMENVDQMVIIPMNNDNAQGFVKPIVSTQVDRFYEVFMEHRKNFSETYGI